MKHTMITLNKFFTSIETYIFGMLGMLGSFLFPITPFLVLAGGLIILDTVTGIRAARKRKEKLNSKGFSRVVDKIIAYGAAIIACHGVDMVLQLNASLPYFAVGAIAFTELMSVLENTRVVSGANIAGVVGGLLTKFQKVPEPDEQEKNKDVEE